MNKPNSIHRAKRLYYVKDLPKVVAQCVHCKWESLPLGAPETWLEDGKIHGLQAWDKGWLSGAFFNHACKEVKDNQGPW